MRLIWLFVLTLSLVQAPASFAGASCFQASAISPKVFRARAEAELDHLFSQISRKASNKILNEIEKKIGKGKFSELDLAKQTRRFQDALEGPRYRRIFTRLSRSAHDQKLELTSQFYHELEALVAREGVRVHDSTLIRARLGLIANEAPIAALKTLAVYGALNAASYNATGSLFYSPIYMPMISHLHGGRFSHWRATAEFYQRILRSLITGYFAISLGYEFATGNTGQVKELLDIMNGAVRNGLQTEVSIAESQRPGKALEDVRQVIDEANRIADLLDAQAARQNGRQPNP
ncbi:MAG TPA: hypothetical protein VFV50_10515 [Bdellovibrionales bacterium]|nr:hypothetical protein [Bdellovibrionales bacterium]